MQLLGRKHPDRIFIFSKQMHAYSHGMCIPQTHTSVHPTPGQLKPAQVWLMLVWSGLIWFTRVFSPSKPMHPSTSLHPGAFPSGRVQRGQVANLSRRGTDRHTFFIHTHIHTFRVSKCAQKGFQYFSKFPLTETVNKEKACVLHDHSLEAISAFWNKMPVCGGRLTRPVRFITQLSLCSAIQDGSGVKPGLTAAGETTPRILFTLTTGLKLNVGAHTYTHTPGMPIPSLINNRVSLSLPLPFCCYCHF